MGVISESAVWEDNVLQIEVGDPVGGGPSAVVNLQAQDLANRTKWLKENKFDASNFGEFYPEGITPTYVDANTFTVPGDLTAIFTKGRVLKITDTGGTFNAVCSASAYDAGTELTTVTVAGDTIDSGISAVLYAVQQHTGAIWESGSNANGEYIKFADGTLVCVINRSMSITTPLVSSQLYYSDQMSITLPAAYIDNSFVVAGTTKTGTSLGMFCAFTPENVGTITGYIVCSNQVTTATNTRVRFMTIGRWY